MPRSYAQPLGDCRNNLLLSHDDSMAPLRRRDASCRQSFMNVRPTPFSRIDVPAGVKARNRFEALAGDNVAEK